MTESDLTRRARAVLARLRRVQRNKWSAVLGWAAQPIGYAPRAPQRQRNCNAMERAGLLVWDSRTTPRGGKVSGYFLTDLGREVARLIAEETR